MRVTVISALTAVMLIASTAAEAGGGHRHARHGHGHARIGIVIGAPLVFSSWWAAPPHYYYSPAPVVVRERIVVREPLVYYDERGNPVPPAQAQSQAPTESAAPTWFFCVDSQSYYPYVRDCASPWQRVAPQPPPPPR